MDRRRDEGRTRELCDFDVAVGACLHAVDTSEIELAADLLGASGDERAIPVLLCRLADTRDDADVEDTVCSALVSLSVMERLGNLTVVLRPFEELPLPARRVLATDRVFVPHRYRAR